MESADYHPDTGMRPPFASECRPKFTTRAGATTRVWLLLVLGLTPSSGATIPRPHRQPKEIVRIIEGLERRWQRAELSANTPVMATMLSDDYLAIYADGMLATKAEMLASFKSGNTHFTSLETSDRKIRVFGSTAVVISKAEVTGVNDGEKLHGQYRYTRVYHRRNGVWKIVSFEASSMHERHLARKPMH